MNATNLFKKCPRCGRLGEVRPDPDHPGVFDIHWPGPARNPFGLPHDIDSGMTLRSLFDPQMGCGYDWSSEAQRRSMAALWRGDR